MPAIDTSEEAEEVYVVREEFGIGGLVERLVPATATDEEPYVETFRSGLLSDSPSTMTPNRPYREGEPVTLVRITDFPWGEHKLTVTGRDLRDAQCQMEKAEYDDWKSRFSTGRDGDAPALDLNWVLPLLEKGVARTCGEA